MNNKTILTVMIPVFLFSFQSYAQSIDSLKNADSLAVKRSVTTFYKPKLRAFIPGALAITYGFVALNSDWLRKLDSRIYENTNKRHPGFNKPIDDYMRYVPAAAIFGLDFLGYKGKNTLGDKTALFFISSVITNGTVGVLKRASNRMRPNHYNDYSFPSGHTASAFAGAELLKQEYGDQSVWYSIAGYTAASATGIFRLYRNYHWFSDVVAGAGIGILSTKFTYLVYPSLKKMVLGKKKSGITLLPVYQDSTYGLAFSAKL